MPPSPEPTRRLFIGRQAPGVQVGILLLLSIVFIILLELVRMPAALLLGPMVAGIVVSAGNGIIRVPLTVFIFAQGAIGCLMARAMPGPVIAEIGRDWPLFAAGIVAVVVVANGLGLLLTRLRILPGTVAIWGSSPGAAAAMVIMAEAYGADFRLVAFMQYLRVVCVAVAASLVALIWGGHGGTGAVPHVEWFPAIDPIPFAQTCALIFIGAPLGRLLKVPAGPMLVPMIGGTILQNTGLVSIELPQWLLAISYALAGWSIGLRFSRPILARAAKAFPQVLASTLTLIAICGGFGTLLVVFAGIDPLTAYLATSPGGADSVAIIAASSNVDIAFVVAMQTARFLVVLFTGPTLARLLVKWAGVSDKPEATGAGKT